jgi:hypothetical protein
VTKKARRQLALLALGLTVAGAPEAFGALALETLVAEFLPAGAGVVWWLSKALRP